MRNCRLSGLLRLSVLNGIVSLRFRSGRPHSRAVDRAVRSRADRKHEIASESIIIQKLQHRSLALSTCSRQVWTRLTSILSSQASQQQASHPWLLGK